MQRRIFAYRDAFINFYKSQDSKTQLKIEYVLDLVRYEEHVPSRFFKYLSDSDGIYEIRVITAFKSIRILCFFDKGDLIVLVNCLVKKSRAVPRNEISIAERMKKEYLYEKSREEGKR